MALNTGPVSASISTTNEFFLYQGGLFIDEDCEGNLDHAILIVGSGIDNATGLAYWKIKNSYGPTWGEDGFMRIAQVPGSGMCGI